MISICLTQLCLSFCLCRQRIAFIDYREVNHAVYAQQCCQGYRFPGYPRGINCRISDNSKRLYPHLRENPPRRTIGANNGPAISSSTSTGVGGVGASSAGVGAGDSNNTYQSPSNTSESRSGFASPPKNTGMVNNFDQQIGVLGNPMPSYFPQDSLGMSHSLPHPQQMPFAGMKNNEGMQMQGLGPLAGLDMSNLNLQAVQGLLNQLKD